VQVLLSLDVIDDDQTADWDSGADHQVGHGEFEEAAEDADQLARAELGISPSPAQQELAGRREQIALEPTLARPAVHSVEAPVEDLAELLVLEPMEDDETVQPIDEIVVEVFLGLSAPEFRDAIFFDDGSALESYAGAFLENFARAEACRHEDQTLMQASESPAGECEAAGVQGRREGLRDLLASPLEVFDE
jgi:hypothetical protein